MALEVPLAKIVAGLQATQPAFGRAESVTVPSAPARRAPAARLRIMLVKNPAGANEVLRTLALEPGRHDLLGVLNDQIADGRDVSWIWDADFELLADRVGRVLCCGARAADLAARFKYAGVEGSRIQIVPELPGALGAGRRRGRAAGALCTPCRPTRRCWPCASCWSARGEAAAHGMSRDLAPAPPAAVVWHDLECGAYRADLPALAELAADGRRPAPAARVCSTSAPAHGRVALELAGRGIP